MRIHISVGELPAWDVAEAIVRSVCIGPELLAGSLSQTNLINVQ